jgi:hypothetical protein
VTPVQHEDAYLDENKAERVEAWVKELVVERKRAEHANAKPRSSRKKSSPGDQAETEATL